MPRLEHLAVSTKVDTVWLSGMTTLRELELHSECSTWDDCIGALRSALSLLGSLTALSFNGEALEGGPGSEWRRVQAAEQAPRSEKSTSELLAEALPYDERYRYSRGELRALRGAGLGAGASAALLATLPADLVGSGVEESTA